VHKNIYQKTHMEKSAAAQRNYFTSIY